MGCGLATNIVYYHLVKMTVAVSIWPSRTGVARDLLKPAWGRTHRSGLSGGRAPGQERILALAIAGRDDIDRFCRRHRQWRYRGS